VIFRTDVSEFSGKGVSCHGRNPAPVASAERHERIKSMLWTLIVLLVLLWAIGFAAHFGGGLIHLLLAIALVVLVVRLITGRRVV
jgi:hypothetical protein